MSANIISKVKKIVKRVFNGSSDIEIETNKKISNDIESLRSKKPISEMVNTVESDSTVKIQNIVSNDNKQKIEEDAKKKEEKIQILDNNISQIIQQFKVKDNRKLHEIKAIKKSAEIEIIHKLKEVYPFEAKQFAYKIFNNNVCFPALKLEKINGDNTQFYSLIKSAKEIEYIKDFIEPNNEYANAIFVLNEIFNAQIICFLRGGEVYYADFSKNQIIELINELKKGTFNDLNLTKREIYDAVIENVISTNKGKEFTKEFFRLLYDRDMIEKDQINDKWEYKYNKFIEDINIAKNKDYSVFTNEDIHPTIIPLSEEDQVKDKFKGYAFLNNKGKSLIVRKIGRDIEYTTKSDLNLKFLNDPVITFFGKEKNSVDTWLKSKNRKSYDAVTFDPSTIDDLDNGETLNLYNGPAYKAKNMIDITFFKIFVLNIICSGDKLFFNLVWSFFAQLIQDPKNKIGMILVLISPQGTGKSIFVTTMGNLFGEYFLQSDKKKDITSDFNKHLMNCLLFYANEKTFTKPDDMDRLKSLSTEENRTYEPKFMDSFKGINYTRPIVDTNHFHAIYHQIFERRALYPHISIEKRGDHDYFNELKDQIDQDGFYESLQYDLENFDYTPYLNDMRMPPQNEILLQQLGASLNSAYKWWIYCLSEGEIPYIKFTRDLDGTIVVTKDNLFISYKKYCADSKLKAEFDRDRFHQAWKSILSCDNCYSEHKPTINAKRTKVIKFAKRGYLVEDFIKTHKADIIDYDGGDWQWITA